MALSENVRGAVMMTLAMAAFTCNDAIVKLASSKIGITQIMAIRGVMAVALIYAVTRYLKVRIPLRAFLQPLLLLRSFLEVLAALTFMWALSRIDFATASFIMQAVPLGVTIGAAVFLKQKIGWQRWLTIAIGLFGVMLIVRPSAEGFTTAALVAVVSVVFTAARDVVTRRLSQDTPTLMVTFYSASVIAVAGFLLVPLDGGWKPLDGQILLWLALASLAIFAASQSVIVSMRSGDIAFIAAFRYTGLLWALAISIVFFGETPDALNLVGAAIVLISGLYSFHLERRRERKAVAGG